MFGMLEVRSKPDLDVRSRLFDWEEVDGDSSAVVRRKLLAPQGEGGEHTTRDRPGRPDRPSRSDRPAWAWLAGRRLWRTLLWVLVTGVAAAWLLGAVLSGGQEAPRSGAGGSPSWMVRDVNAGQVGLMRAASEVVYVVQPGDTLWSIAHRLDPGGDERPIVDRLVSELHGTSVYPGEAIQIP